MLPRAPATSTPWTTIEGVSILRWNSGSCIVFVLVEYTPLPKVVVLFHSAVEGTGTAKMHGRGFELAARMSMQVARNDFSNATEGSPGLTELHLLHPLGN
mmetsp:Transcript_8273/g.25876  ORF Transcript_8273/g.25876 Transcript_8273/m.25876 type:complete len:100 (-) Transcript_8273:272-571(-)